jgi:NhaP-type Na+/H+ or K+/H+ antiporter
MVFGEGVVNDATSIVLLRAIQKVSGAPQLNVTTLGQLVANFSQLFVFRCGYGADSGTSFCYMHGFL